MDYLGGLNVLECAVIVGGILGISLLVSIFLGFSIRKLGDEESPEDPLDFPGMKNKP
jgi:hypothetical protein